jgi:hypothetical protein
VRQRSRVCHRARLVSFPFSFQPEHSLERPGLATQEKSAIIKPDRDPAVVTALDNLADLSLKEDFSAPCQRIGNKPHPITYLKTAMGLSSALRHFSPSACNHAGNIPCCQNRQDTEKTDANS